MAADHAGVTIIKRKKVVGGDGHHGGAWKVAYADFVTAMMAFFLLMWLLNATTEEQRRGLAEYFDPKVPIAKISGGGTAMLKGDSIFSESELAQNGTGASKSTPSANEKARGDTGTDPSDATADLGRGEDETQTLPDAAMRETGDGDRDAGAGETEAERAAAEAEAAEAEAFQEVVATLEGMAGPDGVSEIDHVRAEMTAEGLVIELFDLDARPLFERGSAKPSREMQALLRMIADVASRVSNRVAVEGHTDSVQYATTDYDNWELSADRANAARRALIKGGVVPDRMFRVVGRADRDPAMPEDPTHARNRRVAITLMRNGV